MQSYVPAGYAINEAEIIRLRAWLDMFPIIVKDKSDEPPKEETIPHLVPCGQSCPPFICPKGKDHCPKSSCRRAHIKGWLFQAAWHGCLPCVQHCIEVLNVDVQSESDNMKYTVMDWGQWAVDKNVEGAVEVVAYLSSKSS